jgi:hypothetical protein
VLIFSVPHTSLRICDTLKMLLSWTCSFRFVFALRKAFSSAEYVKMLPK